MQLSDELWLQEYCAGLRDRQIAERLRQDTTIRRAVQGGKGGAEIIVARSHNKRDRESVQREWADQAAERARWEAARSRTVGGMPVLVRSDERGRMYVTDENNERVYAPQLVMPAETICARFLDLRTPYGRPVPLYSPIKASTAVKRTHRGGVRRVHFTQSLETMATDAYAQGYREGLQFERDRLAAEASDERADKRVGRKSDRSRTSMNTPPHELSFDELVAAF